MNTIEALKQQAAERALDYVQSDSAIGLGTGSTARYVIEGLAQRLADGRLRRVVAVPTSEATAALARRLDIMLVSLDQCPELDLTIDGADQIDPQLNLIKGLGNSLLREKIVATASARLIVVADDRKMVPQLGVSTPLPVEVIPFAQALCIRRLAALGLPSVLRLGTGGMPRLTDESNYTLDCDTGPIDDPAALDRAILDIPGVVNHGLFLGMASVAVIACSAGVRVFTTH